LVSQVQEATLFCHSSACISTAAAGQPSFGREGCLNHLLNKSKR